MATNTSEHHVGRLIETRSQAGYRTTKDVDDLFAAYNRAWEACGVEHVVTVVDHRHAAIMSPEAASYLKEMMLQGNTRLIRCSTLISHDSPLMTMQYSRIMSEAGSTCRRLFTEEPAAIAWLEGVLTPPERARLIAFLEEGARLNLHVTQPEPVGTRTPYRR